MACNFLLKLKCVDIEFYDSWEKIEVALTTEQPTLASWQINKIDPIDSLSTP